MSCPNLPNHLSLEICPSSLEIPGTESVQSVVHVHVRVLCGLSPEQLTVCPLQMDAADRSCTVSVHCSNHRVKMLVKFPAQYPNNAAPSFQFINPTTITSTMKAKLLKVGIIHTFSLTFERRALLTHLSV